VEAFGAYDTGHDLSPRFWHTPNTSFLEDARQCDPDSPVLPFVAPDLTASVACSRTYLAKMARELGKPEKIAESWERKSAASIAVLRRECYDKADDDAEFAHALERYLLNTRKSFARYPFTSIAMDDPRYDPHQEYNTWAGTSNFLSLIRAPHAFEHHRRDVELNWVVQPILGALSHAKRFPQNLNPWNGEEGFTEVYSPAILCFLDFVERTSGILPRPADILWFTGLTPSQIEGTERAGVSTTYTRTVGEHLF
jgi:hypothetical protein